MTSFHAWRAALRRLPDAIVGTVTGDARSTWTLTSRDGQDPAETHRCDTMAKSNGSNKIPIMAFVQQDSSTIDEEEEEKVPSEIVKIETSGMYHTIFNFVNSIIGSGVIGIPYALHQSGFGLGLILLVIVAFVTDYSLRILVISAIKADAYTYPKVAEVAFGKPAAYMLTVLQFTFPFIAMTSYNVIIADNLPQILLAIFQQPNNSWLRSGVMALTFMCHHNIFLLYAALRNASIERWVKVTDASVAVSWVIVMVIGISGYVSFTGYSQGDILVNYCPGDITANLARALFIITIMLTYPIQCFVTREVVENALFSTSTLLRQYIVTVVIVVLIFLISSLTKCLKVFLEINGVFVAVPLAYIIPSILYMKLEEGPIFSSKKLPALILFSSRLAEPRASNSISGIKLLSGSGLNLGFLLVRQALVFSALEEHVREHLRMFSHVTQRSVTLPARIQPPETFDFSTPNEWPKWRKRFERYLVVSGMKKKEEADKIDLFMYLMGDRADDIFRTFKFEKEEEATKIDSVLKAFDSHFCVRKNIIYERAKFNSRIQEDREPVDEFITSLYKLADSCEFEGLHEQLIRDRIVVGVRDKALSERMQLDSELTLEKAVKLVRQQEAVRQQQVDLQRPSTSQKVNQVKFNSKKQSPKQQQQPSRKKEKSAKTRSRCPKCGGFNHREGQACRAEGQRCNLCSITGHFANCCPDKQAKTAEVKAVSELDEEIGFLLEVSAVEDSSNLDDDEGECRRRWTAEIQVNGKKVKFKLDSQADVTCVPLCLLKKNQDPSLGLLEYRSTPLENGYSPAELLMGRKLRTTLPIAPENLNPKLVDSQTLKRKEGRRRKDMKSRYDRRCGATDMEELSEGDTVWITDMRTWGIVKKKASTPRSYMVDTPVGTLRRNRFHLRKGYAVQYPADPSNTTFSGEELVENEKTPVVDYPSNDSEDGQIRTRSGRIVKPVDRLHY
ncbi:SLC38A11 [Cordylochernes scorpioides]|uniref:Putative sodium-coupled neutral amino acid transporter 11 n=1 Tax=Cordylochernes scorpioides TaxID=51811 RepID=A0ABY6JYB7_9ARAC|nr:SLC38A11 [Cordylochernes scorpioides]